MRWLRRLLGATDVDGEPAPSGESAPSGEPAQDDLDDPSDEAADREILREADDRLDEFRRRQLRYARWAWRPPAQGGPQRADAGEPAGGTPDADDAPT